MEKSTVINPMPPGGRIASVDVYRGFVMLLMMGEVLSFQSVAIALPDNKLWQVLAFNQSHVPWTWLSLHDMIQPSFSFLVGVVLPFSLASRINKVATTTALLGHALFRSLILVFLGFFLRSLESDQTNYTFEDTLTQIGLGYTFLVMLGFCSRKVQIGRLLLFWLVIGLPLPCTHYPGPALIMHPQA